MIEITHNGNKSLIILNNRVFKRLADLGIMDIISNEDSSKIDDDEFIESLSYLGYLEGCKYSNIEPIDEAKFKLELSRIAVLKIQNHFIEQLIEIGEYVSTKKK